MLPASLLGSASWRGAAAGGGSRAPSKGQRSGTCRLPTKARETGPGTRRPWWMRAGLVSQPWCCPCRHEDGRHGQPVPPLPAGDWDAGTARAARCSYGSVHSPWAAPYPLSSTGAEAPQIILGGGRPQPHGPTFSASSRLMARASCSCSSSSPVVCGLACSRSEANRGDEDDAGREKKTR